MKNYYLMLLVLVTGYSNAEDLQYFQQDYKEVLRNHIVASADLNTGYCMHRYAPVLLGNGMRDQKEIVNNLVKVCGKHMKQVLLGFENINNDLAQSYVEAMAYDELLKIPGVKLAETKPINKPVSKLLTKPATRSVEPKLVKFKDGHSEYIVTDPKTGQVRRWDAPN